MMTTDERIRNEILLAVHELVSNVIRHGSVEGDTLTVSLDSTDERVRIEVCNEGEGFDPNDAPPGWGLYLLSRIASRWGADRNERDWCVWFEKDLAPATG